MNGLVFKIGMEEIKSRTCTVQRAKVKGRKVNVSYTRFYALQYHSRGELAPALEYLSGSHAVAVVRSTLVCENLKTSLRSCY